MKIVVILLVIVAFVFLRKRKDKDIMNIEQIKKSDFKLLSNKGRNTYYIFPKDEHNFKKESFDERKMLIKIIYPNGNVKSHIRKVRKVWESSVLWNLETMTVPDTSSKLNTFSGLIIYAYPAKYDFLLNIEGK